MLPAEDEDEDEDEDGRHAIGCNVSDSHNTSCVLNTGRLFLSNEIDSLCLHLGDGSACS